MIEAITSLDVSPFDDLEAIRDWLIEAGPALVALDFDGTLTEIVDDPTAPVLTNERRALLARIPGESRRLAIVSGRSIEDLRRRVEIPGAILLGNHGLEIEGPEIRQRPLPAVAERLVLALEQVSRALDRDLGEHVRLEDKRWTATLHLRPRDDAERHAAVGAAIVEPVRAAGFELRPGKASWEIRPAGAPDKGGALQRLIEVLPGASARHALYVGDDVTDEDAFRALRDGVTIRVGERGTPTAARYRLAGPAEVYQLLGALFLPGE